MVYEKRARRKALSGAANQREGAVMYAHRIARKAFLENRRVFAIEGFDLRGSKRTADAGARTNPPAPCLVRVRGHHVEREGLDFGKARIGDVPGPSRIDADGAAQRPFRIMLDD